MRGIPRSLAVILIAGMGAACLYFHQRSILRAKGNRLREDLFVLRTVLDEYAFDCRRAPRTIENLLQEHYLREMPIDPITGSRTTWRIVMENRENAVDKPAPGIWEIKSGSKESGSNGKRYSEW